LGVTTHALPTLALVPGDPAGIGPEVLAAALKRGRLPAGVRYDVVSGAARASVRLGRPSAGAARAALDGLTRAVDGCLSGKYAGVVNGPVCKETLQGIGFPHPGVTEYLAQRAGLKPEAVTMSMAGPKLRVFLVSTHVSLRDAVRLAVSPGRLIRTLNHARGFLQGLGIATPRLAVAGLNPHAGEHGMFGDEEGRCLEPTLRAAGFAGVPVVSPDAVFLQAVQGRYDGVVALYHDQGLIPFKLLHFDRGVNVTLGLPFVRTSPDHGTAFDIAGKGKADAGSMIEAIRLAARMAKGSL
jgi:4-hydroxythreonine-4-phosphate dehydrogenase